MSIAAKSARKRGVILTTNGWNKFQNTKREFELQNNNGNRYSYEELSDRTNLSLHTISRILARTEKVDKRSLEYCFQAFGIELDKGDYTQCGGPQAFDWSEAADIGVFQGRNEELMQLQQWVLIDRCRLIAVLGMGGIGKTTLASKFARQVQHEFEYLIWRSISKAPSLNTLVADLVSFLSNHKETKGDIGRLMHYLRNSRCLLILDNLESVLDPGYPGQYLPGYEGYSQLLQVIGETTHQSCLMLTSREKPSEIASSEGTDVPVHSLKLGGCQEAASSILELKGLIGSEKQKQQLCDRYGNSPQVIKIVATSILDLFDGNIKEFLKQRTVVFNGIRRLLEQQFNRLSHLEQTIMYWLTINGNWTTITDLINDIIPTVSKVDLLEALEGLIRRSLLEMQLGQYTLQPLIMEYVKNHIIEQVFTELKTKQLNFFMSYALEKNTVKDIEKTREEKLILHAIADSFHTSFPSQKAQEQQIQEILEVLLDQDKKLLYYGGSNLMNLCQYLQIDTTRYEFDRLNIQHPSRKKENLLNMNVVRFERAKAV
ncbi:MULTISPECIES: NB-ARC domain-containing protein [Nostocales]|uniref:NB-ARC domain-containing protein n=3 Tax=Nostocales TaxID=1161 RepID=A0A8S9TCZ5_9CYAN|nr:NB-ARC domain-containing protein [Tolypothrix bouteillei]KAF3889273.1 hypothetical protein DA73_0400030160 [Tolypothrix bouteillei VB521301]